MIPVGLGVLAFVAHHGANKISDSQYQLAVAQFEYSQELSTTEQSRENKELDTQLIELFGDFYFDGDPAKRSFAVSMIQRLTSPEIQEALAETIAKDLEQDDTEQGQRDREEALAIAEDAVQRQQQEFGQLDILPWGVVIGADVSAESALNEVWSARSLGFEQVYMFLRNNSFRTVIGFSSAEEANENLSRIKRGIRDSSYGPVDLKGWCSNPSDRGNYFVCQ